MDCHHTPCTNTLPAGMRADAKYCSDACRMAAVTERRRAQRPERPQRACRDCSEPLQLRGRAELCSKCRRDSEKTSADLTLLANYGHLISEIEALWQKFEADAQLTCFGEGMHDIAHKLMVADDSPLSRHEKKKLTGTPTNKWEVDGVLVTGDGKVLHEVLTKYREHPAVRDRIEARLDELAVRHKRLRHGTRHGIAALRFR